MAPPAHRSSPGPFAAAVLAVAATYVYFLIFAQFGFLRTVTAALGAGAGVIRPVMGAMGLAGIAGSVMAARFFSRPRGARQFAGCLVLAATAAAGSLVATGPTGFQLCALLVGLGTGGATVTLAALLRGAAGVGRLGLVTGLGTGAAYAFCNLPGVFAAGAVTQAWIALAAALAGSAAALGLTAAPADEAGPAGNTSAQRAGWVLFFLALVGLDSAAFYFIQHTPALQAATWAGPGQLLANAAVHLIAALLAGAALDRGRLGPAVALAAGALLAACLLIRADHPSGALVALLYTTGVSIYSTALVYYPARRANAGLAAWVYAVAGWGGSALGIGWVDGRTELPAALLAATAALLAAGFWLRRP